MGAQDEASFGLIGAVRRGWAEIGSRPKALLYHVRKYVNVFAVRTQKSFIYLYSKKKSQKAFIRLLKKARNILGRIFLFVDGAKAHKGKLVQKFLKNNRKTIRLAFFPPYSPEVNPTEQCWKIGRKQVANKPLKSVQTVKYQLSKVFDDSKLMPKMFHYLCH